VLAARAKNLECDASKCGNGFDVCGRGEIDDAMVDVRWKVVESCFSLHDHEKMAEKG
jgi:hypothetical protein